MLVVVCVDVTSDSGGGGGDTGGAGGGRPTRFARPRKGADSVLRSVKKGVYELVLVFSFASHKYNGPSKNPVQRGDERRGRIRRREEGEEEEEEEEGARHGGETSGPRWCFAASWGLLIVSSLPLSAPTRLHD
ncbi:hypothetical protein HZH68_012793 [Vespula germanica]|uniref:Uncharacterized protein n=1 Tax=Vespula germanica TaxID=30212 RepID=A0A834JG79_VESGE|nr:hypothetical protein HZH68_012793 [Vespula germanica]